MTPFLEIVGSAYDIGLAIGRKFRELIQSFVAAKHQELSSEWPSSSAISGAEQTRQEFLDWCHKLLPSAVEQMRGYADGAGVSFENIVTVNCCDEIRSHQITSHGDGCTAFALDSAFTGGPVLAGQSKDGPVAQQERYVVLLTRPKDAPAVLQIAYPGMLALLGMSECGFCVFTNRIYTGAVTSGLPLMLLKLLAWRMDRVEQIEPIIAKHGTSAAANLMFCDRFGHASCFEVRGASYGRCDSRDGILVHTNHYLCDELRGDEDEELIKEFRSKDRLERLTELFGQQRGRINPEAVFDCFRDHAGHPRGICAHETRESAYGTTAVLVAEPQHGRLHISTGRTCQSTPVTYQL